MLAPRQLAECAIQFVISTWQIAEYHHHLYMANWQPLPDNAALVTVAIGNMLTQHVIVDRHGCARAYHAPIGNSMERSLDLRAMQR